MELTRFLNGRAKSLEQQLIPGTFWEQAAAEKSFSSWLKKITEYYPDIEKHSAGFEAFEEFLNRSLMQTKADLFKQQFPAELRVLWLKYDFQNLKLHFRRETSPFNSVDEDLQQVYLQAAKIADQKPRDQYLDREYFRLALASAGDLAPYIRRQIAAANYKLRWNNSTEVIPGSETELNFGKTDDPAIIQKKLDEYVLQDLFARKYSPTGYWPAVLYWIAKELEIKNLKTAYLALSKNLPELFGYLRVSYV